MNLVSWHNWFENDKMSRDERFFRDEVNLFIDKHNEIDESILRCKKIKPEYREKKYNKFFAIVLVLKAILSLYVEILDKASNFIDNNIINDKNNIRQSNRRYFMLKEILDKMKTYADFNKLVLSNN